MSTARSILATVVAVAVTAFVAAPALAASSATSASSGPPECSNAALSATYRGTGAGAGHTFGRLILTNTSSRACTVRGYGGLSYVGGGDGSQVGAAADRSPVTKVRTVLVQPGGRVSSRVSEASPADYSRAQCRPTRVDGFRVYVPDSTRSQFVSHPTTACRATGVHLLTHEAYAPVAR